MVNKDELAKIITSTIYKALNEGYNPSAADDHPDAEYMSDDMFDRMMEALYAPTVKVKRAGSFDGWNDDDYEDGMDDDYAYFIPYTYEGECEPGYDAPIAYCHDDPAFSDPGAPDECDVWFTVDGTVKTVDEDGVEEFYKLTDKQIQAVEAKLRKTAEFDTEDMEIPEEDDYYDDERWDDDW